MKRYEVRYGMNTLISTSRNAKKHARDLGNDVEIYSMSGKLISAAGIDENGKAYNKYIG